MTSQDADMTWEQSECWGLIPEKGTQKDVKERTGTHFALWFPVSLGLRKTPPSAAKSCNWSWVTQTPQRMVPPTHFKSPRGTMALPSEWPRTDGWWPLQAWVRESRNGISFRSRWELCWATGGDHGDRKCADKSTTSASLIRKNNIQNSSFVPGTGLSASRASLH